MTRVLRLRGGDGGSWKVGGRQQPARGRAAAGGRSYRGQGHARGAAAAAGAWRWMRARAADSSDDLQ